MTDIRAQLADLASSAGKESTRLARIERVDPREELQVRVWPFLAELVDMIEASLIGDDGAPVAIPVEVVARAVGLLLSMANRLGELVRKAEMDVFALRAAEVTEELMSLCDPDELALYIHTGATTQAYANEPPSTDSIIDATLVEDTSDDRPASPADAMEVVSP